MKNELCLKLSYVTFGGPARQPVLMPAPPEILWLPLTWAFISFMALHFYKANMITWILVSLGIGIIKFILQGA